MPLEHIMLPGVGLDVLRGCRFERGGRGALAGEGEDEDEEERTSLGFDDDLACCALVVSWSSFCWICFCQRAMSLSVSFLG